MLAVQLRYHNIRSSVPYFFYLPNCYSLKTFFPKPFPKQDSMLISKLHFSSQYLLPDIMSVAIYSSPLILNNITK